MKINSEKLWEYINELATGEKVKFNVYYDDQYVTQIYWNGESFEWGTGTFTSEAFFNPLYDFVVVEEQKKIPEKIYLEISDDTYITNIYDKKYKGNKDNFKELSDMYRQKINEIIDYLKSKGE